MESTDTHMQNVDANMQNVDANMDANSVVEPIVEPILKHLNTNPFEIEINSEIMTAFAPMEVEMVFNPAKASLDVEPWTFTKVVEISMVAIKDDTYQQCASIKDDTSQQCVQ
ncbi:hypothetical protein Tco_1207002, partial [Tanacetum coccineum]